MKAWAIAALWVVVAACSPPAPTPSPVPSPTSAPTLAGLSVDEATPLLLANAGSAATGVEWIRHGALGDFVAVGTINMDFRRLVWAAKLTGRFAASCVAGHPCPPDSISSSLVVIDYYTGEFITQTMGL